MTYIEKILQLRGDPSVVADQESFGSPDFSSPVFVNPRRVDFDNPEVQAEIDAVWNKYYGG